MNAEPIKTIVGSPNDKKSWIYQKEDGMFVREVDIESRKPETKAVRILFFTDVHLNAVNEQDLDNEEVMYTKECRKWNANAASVPALEKAMKYGESFDRIVIGGDVLDYLSCGAMELMDKYVWDKDPHVIVTPGGHELTRQMQTGRPDKTTIEERIAVVENFWRHDMHYYSEVLGDKVMLIQLDNSLHQYWACQIERLAHDIKLARQKNLVILIFQHEAISTGKPEDATAITAFRESPGAGNTRNFYRQNAAAHFEESDEVTREVYRLLTENADVIKAIFCGHFHSAYYSEVKASYVDANGQQQETVIPQYVEEALVYDNYVGHVMEITVK